MSTEPEYVTHCVGCGATDQLAMFAHRIEGQMVGWIFACPHCALKVPHLVIEIQLVSEDQPPDGGEHVPLVDDDPEMFDGSEYIPLMEDDPEVL